MPLLRRAVRQTQPLPLCHLWHCLGGWRMRSLSSNCLQWVRKSWREPLANGVVWCADTKTFVSSILLFQYRRQRCCFSFSLVIKSSYVAPMYALMWVMSYNRYIRASSVYNVGLIEWAGAVSPVLLIQVISCCALVFGCSYAVNPVEMQVNVCLRKWIGSNCVRAIIRWCQ